MHRLYANAKMNPSLLWPPKIDLPEFWWTSYRLYDESYSDKRTFNRCKPSRIFLDNLISSGSLGMSSAVHSQNEAINAARSGDNLKSARPASMIGIRAAAARNRFSSGEGEGRDFGIRRLYQRRSPYPLRYLNNDD